LKYVKEVQKTGYLGLSSYFVLSYTPAPTAFDRLTQGVSLALRACALLIKIVEFVVSLRLAAKTYATRGGFQGSSGIASMHIT
jgi:NO-binding membrane sensor protein with MHYT domain